MAVEEVFSRLSAHMIKGLMIHDQMASAYYFLNLCGYKKCHEYHYFHESLNYRCLQNYYLKHYNKLIPETEVKDPEIIPTNWYKYTRADVDANTKRTEVRNLMKKWVDWEVETKDLLEQSYKELYESGDICAALKISWFLKDTSKELAHAQAKQMDLDNMSYDIGVILGEQMALHDKYECKLEKLFEDDD